VLSKINLGHFETAFCKGAVKVKRVYNIAFSLKRPFFFPNPETILNVEAEI